MGKTVGRPCGELVTGPGEIKFFRHPASGVPFQVSTKIWKWPGVPSGALVTTEFPIPLTVKEVQKHIDPVHGWFDTFSDAARAYRGQAHSADHFH